MVTISPSLAIPLDEIQFDAIRSQGPGGQNVNKVSTAVHLRFDIRASSLPAPLKARLLAASDRRISSDGIVVIKAQRHRSQEMNREDALDRLRTIVEAATKVAAPRRPTKPSHGSRVRRLEGKKLRGLTKASRARIEVA